MSDTCCKFCFSLSFLACSVYTKRWHSRDVFSIGLVHLLPCNEKYQMKQNQPHSLCADQGSGHAVFFFHLLSSRNPNAQGCEGQEFATCPEDLPCVRARTVPVSWPWFARGMGKQISSLEITGSEFNSRAVHPKWLQFLWHPSVASIIFCVAVNILPAVEAKIHFFTRPTQDPNSRMP